VTFIVSAVVLISVSFGSPVPEFAGLLIPTITALVQENVTPVVPLVGVYENTLLLHIGGATSKLVRVGLGFTVTTTF
jgi:hypothetical protein